MDDDNDASVRDDDESEVESVAKIFGREVFYFVDTKNEENRL